MKYLKEFDYKYSIDKNGFIYTYIYNNKPKKMKLQLSNSGYLRVGLIKNKKQKKYLVHRLMLETYIGKSNGLVANHKDRIKTNNKISNLEWVTFLQNVKHWAKKQGIYKVKNRYKVHIQKNNKAYFVGSFIKKSDAIIARNLKYKQLYGEI
jgi:hypothetical protein